MTHAWRALLALAVLLVLPPAASASDPVRHIRVHFERGTSGATLHGHIEGRETVEYRLGVRAGQMMRVHLATRQGALHFNVFEPGRRPGQDAALFIGANGGHTAEFRTAHNGDYLVQVYLMPAAARRGESASYSIEFGVAGGAPPAAPHRSVDALVPGTDFHATGELPCARERGQPMVNCRFGVHRAGHGNGAITVFWPGGGNRVIFYEDNTPMRFDQSQADGDARMTVGSEAGLYHVRIGHQRFEIIEAIMTGG